MAETKKTENEEKTVKIRLPRIRNEEPVDFVSVNEKIWWVKRGEEVEVPECVAELFRHKEEAQELAFEFDYSVKK